MRERVGSKAEQVYETVKEAILSGELEAGQAIDKLSLCEKLDVSRFPVSAALGRLAFERLVRIEPQHGSFVAPISAGGVREHLFVRRALEGEIAAQAAAELSEDGRADLIANLAEAEAAAESGDRALFYVLDVGFHALLTQHLGLHRSEEILDSVRQQLERPRRLLMTPPGRMQETLAEHRAVLAAIEARAPEAARTAMAAHINTVAETFEALAKAKPGLFAP